MKQRVSRVLVFFENGEKEEFNGEMLYKKQPDFTQITWANDKVRASDGPQ